MPKDLVTSAYDSVLAEETQVAIEYFQKNDPSILDLPPAQRSAHIRDAARIIAADNAANDGGFGSRFKSFYAKHAPDSTANIGVGPATIGGAASLVGVGPKDWENNPVGATASTAAMAASMVPGGALIGKIPGSTAQMLKTGIQANLPGVFTTARRGEQILGPAGAAGTAGFLGQSFEELNGVPDVPVSTDSKNPGSPATIFSEALARGKKEFMFEAKGGLAGFAVSLGMKGAAMWARGSKDHFDSAMESLRLAGIRNEKFALQEVTDNRLIRGASSIIGVMPIPILSRRFTTAKERVSAALTAKEDEMLDDISPNFSVLKYLYDQNPERYGKLMSEGSERAFKTFGAAAGRYSIVRQGVSGTVDNLIRSERISSAAASTRMTALQTISEVARKRDLPLTYDKAGNVTNMNILSPFSPKVRTFLEQVQNMQRGTVPVDRLVNLKNQARDALKRINPNNPLQDEERVALASIKSAIEADITSAIQAGGSQTLNDNYARLATLDGDWLTLLSGHLDRRASKVQTTFGNERLSEAAGTTFGVPEGFQRHQGPKDMGAFIDDMLKNASPQEIREFSTLVRESGQAGQESIQFAAARKLNEILQGSKNAPEAEIRILYAKKMRDLISGGGKPGGEQEQAFWQLMTEAGVDKTRVRHFVKAADTLWSQYPPETSKFIARSMILRQGKDPISSLASMSTGGLIGSASAAASGSAVGSLGIGPLFSAFLLEEYTRVATSPKVLNQVLAALNPNFGTDARARAAERVMASTLFRDYEQKIKMQAGQGADVLAGALNKFQQIDPANRLADQVSQYMNANPGARP